MVKKQAYLIANFGGPRNLNEIEEFLTSLLTDRDVIRTRLPPFLHRFLFRRVAKKRALKITPDYAMIGGKSPIYEDTEEIARQVAQIVKAPLLTFHRYLPKTHASFLSACEQLECDEIIVFPMFPQFSYATTGSIATWFSRHLKSRTLSKIRWIKSYPDHPAYISAFQACLRSFLDAHHLEERHTSLLFSPHGLPKKFIETGDTYAKECLLSFQKIREAFPQAKSFLAYQSQFGSDEWLRPYTNEFCCQVAEWGKGSQHIVFVPLSFTSDHIETLYEIEHLYLPLIRERGFQAWRCPALNLREEWVRAIAHIFQRKTPKIGNESLIRSP